MSTLAAIQISPLELFATLVTGANTFEIGDLLAVTSGGYVLADNTDRDKVARAMVAAAEDDRYWVVTSANEIMPWAEHGQGANGTLLWLATAGGLTSTRPSGGTVRVQQIAAVVWDSDHVQVFPVTPPVI